MAFSTNSANALLHFESSASASSATPALLKTSYLLNSSPTSGIVTTTDTTTATEGATMKKPSKPTPDFPLTAHNNGQWCKKIRTITTGKSKVYFFGVWADPGAALNKYLADKDDLQAGRIPHSRLSSDRPTTENVVNLFLKRSEDRVKAGDLSAVSFADYVVVGKQVVEHLGRGTDPEQLRPQDFASFRFAMMEKYSLSRWSKIVAVARSMFKWAFESEVIDRMPRFGPDFSVAGKKAKQLQKNSQPAKVLTAAEIRKLMATADAMWKAILVLSINAALGNSDIARLKLSDVGGQWLDFPRGKTGVPRRIWLWPETRGAIAKAITARRQSKSHAADLLFVSKHGGPMVRIGEQGKRTDLIAEGFKRLATAAGIDKPRCGLYWLRHTFQNVGDAALDPVATSSIMGHADSSMAGHYRDSIDDSRLMAVCEHVRKWLFGKSSSAPKARLELRVVG